MKIEEALGQRNSQIISGRLAGETYPSLAKKHSLSEGHIWRILKAQGCTAERKSGSTRERNMTIYLARLEGASIKSLCAEHSLSAQGIRNVLLSEGYKSEMLKQAKAKRDQAIFFARLGGASVKSIMAAHGLSKSSVEGILRSQGLGGRLSRHGLKGERVLEQKVSSGGKLYLKRCEYCGTGYRVPNWERASRRFCSPSCARKFPSKKNEQRDKDIYLSRHVLGLSFSRIGQQFGLTQHRCSVIYREQRLKRILAEDSAGS